MQLKTLSWSSGGEGGSKFETRAGLCTRKGSSYMPTMGRATWLAQTRALFYSICQQFSSSEIQVLQNQGAIKMRPSSSSPKINGLLMQSMVSKHGFSFLWNLLLPRGSKGHQHISLWVSLHDKKNQTSPTCSVPSCFDTSTRSFDQTWISFSKNALDDMSTAAGANGPSCNTPRM